MTLSSCDPNHPECNLLIDLAKFFVYEAPSGQHGCSAQKAKGDSPRIVERKLSGRHVSLHLMKRISRQIEHVVWFWDGKSLHR